jgi:hypothetical protein
MLLDGADDDGDAQKNARRDHGVVVPLLAAGSATADGVDGGGIFQPSRSNSPQTPLSRARR